MARVDTWQSWRERYVKNASHFDAHILKYQRKRGGGTKSVDKRKSAAEPMPIEVLRQSAKPARREEEEEEEEEGSPSRYVHVSYGDDDVGLTVPCSATRATTQHQNASSSRPKPTSKLIPKQPPQAPSHPTRQHHDEPTNARRTAPAASSPRSNADASASATEKPIPDLTALHTRHDTLEILSSSANRQAPSPADGQPEPRPAPRHVKCIKVRLRTPLDMFASEPSSPGRDTAPVVSVGGPSSQTRPAPSAPSAGADGAPVAPVYARAPPRVVDSLHGQVLVDREGHVPRALLHGDRGRS